MGAAVRVVRAGYDRRGTPSRTVVVTLSLASMATAAAYLALFLWWSPPGDALFLTLGLLALPVYLGAAVAAWRGRVIGAAIAVLATTFVCLVPFAATFSVASGVQSLFLAVGFVTLVVVPERLVVTRLVFCGTVILAMLAVEIFAPPATSAVPVDDAVFETMASVTRLGGIAAVLTSLTLILLRTARAERELTRLAAIGERRANTDDLTGIANRRPVMRVLDELDADPTRAACVALVDIDRFKDINDARGHAVGDEVIRAVARRLDHDLAPGCLVARWGGDEFLLLARDGDRGLVATLEALRASIADAPMEVTDGAVDLTLSVGVAFRDAGEGAMALLAAADRALYEAKTSGRDRVGVASPGAAGPAPGVTASA